MKYTLKNKQAILLDMNSTFLFGEDRFSADQDYSITYRLLGGTMPKQQANQLMTDCFEYLAERYPNYQNRFPSVPEALRYIANHLPNVEIKLLADTFAAHERGYLSPEYAKALHNLGKKYRLGAVIDIWAEKYAWLTYFEQQNILHLFESISFSSDHGYVKPSAYGFQLVLHTMQLQPQEAVFIGDSVRRDLGGANAAGLDCILVGGAESDKALASFPNLLEFCEAALTY